MGHTNILTIDEVDKNADNQIFLSFLGVHKVILGEKTLIEAVV